MRRSLVAAAAAAAFLELFLVGAASGQRTAPLIAFDPAANASDLYFFRSPVEDGDGTVTIIATFAPSRDDGPNRFADDVLYEIKLDNDGDAKEDVTYQLTFKTKYADSKSETSKPGLFENRGPIRSLTDENLYLQQTATVTRIDKQGRTEQKNVKVAPPYFGEASYPANPDSRARTSQEAYEQIAESAITTLTTRGGGSLFLGPRDDPFFADLGALDDLFQIRGTAYSVPVAGDGVMNNPVDTVAGGKVLAIALQLPIEAVTREADPSPDHGHRSVVGAWAQTSRPKVVTLRPGKSPSGTGSGWQQVARVGMPLTSWWMVPLSERDLAGSATPREDGNKLVQRLAAPLLAKRLLAQYHVAVPSPGRTDLLNLYSWKLGLAPLDVAGEVAADLLRLDVSAPAAATGKSARLGLLAGDGAGFPNGRRLTDDVVDVVLRAIAGALCVEHATCDCAPNLSPLGDGVDGNDRNFLRRFPYLAPPLPASSRRR